MADDVCILIPARYQSSRFPGKPLALIAGVPMIVRVHALCAQAAERVYVATDDRRIMEVCAAHEIAFVETDDTPKTGTDRLAQAARRIDAHYYVNVQGDEPLIDPSAIIEVIEAKRRVGGDAVVNAMCPIADEDEWRSRDVPKVVHRPDGELLYMSRAPIPMTKTDEFKWAKKQVCVYGFTREELERFAAAPERTPVEAVEDIEILRFVELGHRVRMVDVPGGSIGVDRPGDVARVETELARRA